MRDPCGEEQCDGADLGGQTCGSLGFYGGTPSCLANCCLSLADCQGTCGDGYDGAVSGYTLELVCAKQ
ncbi:MAG: hypothetical protein HY906_11125 [Deltaproteobacteria bacterium]|nr:hypothetical protein [Deltaproteobacteria bacterium]